jgi:hypothetical protein
VGPGVPWEEALQKSSLEQLRAAAGGASGPLAGAFWVTISMAVCVTSIL